MISGGGRFTAIVVALLLVHAHGFLPSAVCRQTQRSLITTSSSTARQPAVSVLSMSTSPAQREEPVLSPLDSSGGSGKVLSIADTDGFLEAMAASADRPVVIKFYDTFCRACKAIALKYERMAQQNPGVSFYEVEFSASKRLCKSLGITLLPTIQIYQGGQGKVADMPVGPKRFHIAETRLQEILEESGVAGSGSAAIHIPQ